jgi:CubicO group peptidase (beta-lactamase class C family)
MGARLLVVLALFLAACADTEDTFDTPPVDAVPTSGDGKLSGAAAGAVVRHSVPAIAVAHVSLDEATRSGVAGTRSHDDDTALDLGSRFHLGSDTKAMTALLVAQLVEAGWLAFDSVLAEVLPDMEIDPSLAAVTISDVLGHRTGLVDDLDLPALHEATDAVAARRQAVHDALRAAGGEPGTFAYANVNYMVAGVIIEEITGAPWDEVLRDRLFSPLGMTGCGLGAPAGRLDPLGHTAGGEPVAQDARVTDNPAAMGPAGTVHCPIEDWAAFARAVLDLLAGNDTVVLTAATAADLFAADHDYVAGWVRLEQGGSVTYAHDGSNTLWYARAVLRPERRDAVLVATNSGQPGAVSAIEELSEFVLRT